MAPISMSYDDVDFMARQNDVLSSKNAALALFSAS